MADGAGAEVPDLEAELLERGKRFNFFKLVAALERQHQGALVGEQGPAESEAIRFRGHPSMAFPATDIAKLSINSGSQYELETNFIGLYGPASPMPAYITEAVIAEQVQIENEEVQDYFLQSESDVRQLRDNRLNLTARGDETKQLRGRVNAGELISKPLSDRDIDRIRQGVPVSELLSEEEYQQFKDNSLVLLGYEKPASRQRDFFDVFNHRLTSLLYRGWKKYRPALQYQQGAEDGFSQWLFSLIGAPGPKEREGSALNWPRLLGFMGPLSMNSGSASVIRDVVSAYFGGVAVELEENLLRWASIPGDQQARLGFANSSLGTDINLGQRVPDRNAKFRVTLGPLSLIQFESFLPKGENYKALLELVEFLMPAQLCFDIELILTAEEVPSLQLGQQSSALLGWCSWLGQTGDKNQSVMLSGLD